MALPIDDMLRHNQILASIQRQTASPQNIYVNRLEALGLNTGGARFNGSPKSFGWHSRKQRDN